MRNNLVVNRDNTLKQEQVKSLSIIALGVPYELGWTTASNERHAAASAGQNDCLAPGF